jgi:hypothetical protein
MSLKTWVVVVIIGMSLASCVRKSLTRQASIWKKRHVSVFLGRPVLSRVTLGRMNGGMMWLTRHRLGHCRDPTEEEQELQLELGQQLGQTSLGAREWISTVNGLVYYFRANNWKYRGVRILRWIDGYNLKQNIRGQRGLLAV